MRLPKGATEFDVPAGIILPVERNGKPRTKTHGLVLEVAGLLNGWSVKLLLIRLGVVSGKSANLTLPDYGELAVTRAEFREALWGRLPSRLLLTRDRA